MSIPTTMPFWGICLLALVFLSNAPLSAADYYLSPDGNDEAAGDRDDPWQTIARANETLQPGDTAIFLPGEYAGVIAPANNGSAGAPLTYRSAEPRGARLVPGEGEFNIDLRDREHITIDGFHVDGQMRARWILARNSHHITISGCTMRNTPRPCAITHCTQLRLLDNLFSQDRSGPSDMMWLEECSEVLVEGNSFTRAGHSPFTLNYVNNAVIRGNVFHAEWGRNYITYSLGRVLWDGNIIARARDSGGSASSRAHSFWDYGIFRNNRVFDNLAAPLNMGSYIWQGVSHTGRFRGPFGTANSRFYHNTFTDALGPVWSIGGINVSSNVFQNNIFYRNDYLGGNTQFTRSDGISRDNRFISNLFRGTEPGQAIISHEGNRWTVEEANERTRTIGGVWSEFHLNIDADPAFVDPASNDYRLRPDSGAIDAGEPLARAVGSGTGRALPVNDGIVFYDGFGIEGEQGDFIAIGSGENIARIERIELRHHQPAILHLDREVTWTDEMFVSLPWAGEAPDIGAYQHGLAHDPTRIIALASPAIVAPGEPVSFSLDALGKELQSVLWDFGDGTFSDEAAPTHVFDEPWHYAVTVRATCAEGRRSVDALFIRVEEPVDPSDPMVEADFESATRDTHWGYQFKFYRGHQTGHANVERPDGEGRSMHLFYDPGKANRTAAQLAPGAWDIDRYPFVRFEYRIPPGVPVTVQFSPFSAPGRPGAFHLAATANQASRFGDLNGYMLVDDGQWREITIDVRRIREVYPELQHLSQFMFNTPWAAQPPPAQWLRFPAVQSEFTSRPAGPEDTGVLHSLDIVLLRARQAGSWVQMPFTLQRETTGEFFVDLLNHTDRGAVRVLLNDEVVLDHYDHRGPTEPQSVSLGTLTLPAGEHNLRVEVTDQQVGFVGLAGITIRPEGATDEPERALESFEFWFDNFFILPTGG